MLNWLVIKIRTIAHDIITISSCLIHATNVGNYFCFTKIKKTPSLN